MDRFGLDSAGTGDDAAEYPRYFQAGRLSMLFSLVDGGKLTVDEAADFTGMEWEDAADMLQGWREAQRV